ncbi:MAG: hypothetical protein JSW11_12070 [Candidatus Heimdallarchaeota archaeon]|nr:MAG: hypothetical protein JSW11_12070 [Candidatus Heimdallarchaeota archaeon]
MSEKNIVLTCIWRSDDFAVSETRVHPSENEAVLIIDENTEKISIQIPRHFSLITKKIIERRVQSISKSGFLIPKTQVRIGTGFEVEIVTEEEIPEVLLQEGHKYSLDRPTAPTESPSQPETDVAEEEYVPTFLTQEQPVSDTSTIVKAEPGVEVTEEEYVPTFLTQERSVSDTSTMVPAEPPAPETLPPKTPETELFVHDAESIAGRFIIALTKTGDVYVTHKNDQYSVEYSAGRVDFRIHDGDIKIIMTKRITKDDQSLKQAILTATRKKSS